MIKKKAVAVAVLALGIGGIGLEVASASGDPQPNAPHKASTAKVTTIPTIKTSGKMAAIYSPARAVFVAKKNVADVQSPSVGVYCFKPASSIKSLNSRLVDVQVEWDTSYGSDLSAYWSRSAYECPAGYPIGVRTYKYPGGVPTLSSGVSFSFVVN
jgi:hypothetical protein